ncbi:MAG: deoxyribose-phosphate aldolase [Cyclobacteriaceae bacterium]
MLINEYLEHTRLNPDLTDKDIDELVGQAIQYKFIGVCVPPFWVVRAKRELEKSPTNLVTVVGFPLGYQMTETKLKECAMAIDGGADEIDLVINVSALKSGMPWVKIELAKCAALLHQSNVVLKVILETALLSDSEIIMASKLASDAGADYIKTSTGFSHHGAKTEHIKLIRGSIPASVGIKASGGIKSYAQCLELIEAGASRIGASSAVKIVKESNEHEH